MRDRKEFEATATMISRIPRPTVRDAKKDPSKQLRALAEKWPVGSRMAAHPPSRCARY